MKQQKEMYKTKTLIFIFITLFLAFNTAKSIAQPNKPHMWVKKEISTQTEQNFESKHFILSNYLKKEETDSIFYDIGIFKKMIEDFGRLPDIAYVNAVLATFDEQEGGATSVPPGYGSLITLIFVPTNSKGDVLGYYFIPPGVTDINTVTSLGSTPASRWIQNYEDKQKKCLLLTLESNDQDNYIGADIKDPTKFSDTRAIRYPYTFFAELNTEVDYQTKVPRHYRRMTSGIKAFLSCIPFKGIQHFKNRLFVQFEFTQKINGKDEVYYLDNTYKFFKRNDPSTMVDWKSSTRLDNGQLCPPNNNCP